MKVQTSKTHECKKCILTNKNEGVLIDESGVCNICQQTFTIRDQYGTGEKKGKETLENILHSIRESGLRKKYDCIIGVSGGTDSSFIMHLAVMEWHLRPLIVHYDNTWNTPIAESNLKKMLEKLSLDFEVLVVNNHEATDLFRSFFFAGVAELDSATDLGYAHFLRKIASKYRIKYILEAHSYTQEGITPLSRNYFDAKYVKDIHKKWGKTKIKTYPSFDFFKFLYYILIKRSQIIRPLWYINYSKKSAIELLNKEYAWEYYGGHHHENRMTAFQHSFYLPKKFGIDTRINSVAALVREGEITKYEGRKIMDTAPTYNDELLEYFMQRCDISVSDFQKIMSEPTRSWHEFKTYKKTFQRLRFFFRILAKKNIVPMSFYLKYCAKEKK